MKKITALLVFLIIVGIQAVSAQDREITGTVTSATDGSPVPGVNVVVKGTTIGDLCIMHSINGLQNYQNRL